MLYTHAQHDAKEAALEMVSRVLFLNVPNLGDSESEKEMRIQ